jgi:hypothetical protein
MVSYARPREGIGLSLREGCHAAERVLLLGARLSLRMVSSVALGAGVLRIYGGAARVHHGGGFRGRWRAGGVAWRLFEARVTGDTITA